MTTETAREFNKKIITEKAETDLDEIILKIENKPENYDFYFLCREFVELAINAPRIKVDDIPTIQAVYEFEKVDRLAEKFNSFIVEHSIKDAAALLLMIKHRYRNAITNDEINKNAGFIARENYERQSAGYIGKFYDFTYIVCWEEIEKDILNSI